MSREKKSLNSPQQAVEPPELPEEARDAFVEEGEQILSFASLRAAFSNIDSDRRPDSGFQWENAETSPHRILAAAQSFQLRIHAEEPDEEPSEKDRDLSHAEGPEFVDSGGEEPAKDAFDEESSESDDDEYDELEPIPEGISDNGIELSPASIFEAMLFVGNKENRPVSAEKASELMRNVSPEEIEAVADELLQKYAAWNCPYEIIRDEEGYRMILRDDFESIRAKFYGRIKEARLSQSAIDVLSIVAYRQPISAEEIQTLRKQPTGPILSQLVRRELLSATRKTEEKRRITYYQTTERFLQLFGLKNIEDLPVPEILDH